MQNDHPPKKANPLQQYTDTRHLRAVWVNLAKAEEQVEKARAAVAESRALIERIERERQDGGNQRAIPRRDVPRS